jgi:hypothetical protein
MIKSKKEKINAGSIPVISSDSIRINPGSFVIDNTWLSFSGTVFKIKSYIKNVVVGNRTRFFKDRGYAVYLLICIDINDGIKIIEGTHVKFNTLGSVPPPQTYDALPLIGLILVQDGTRDVVNGFKPISDKNIIYFSGTGNIINKDLKGVTGCDNPHSGETGIIGDTGIGGETGFQGETGIIGVTGLIPTATQGMDGYQGITGMYWDIHVPLETLI